MGEECPPLRGGQSWPQIAMGRATSIDTGWSTPGAPAPQRLVGWPPRPADGGDPPEPPSEVADWREAPGMSERGLAADQAVDGLEEMLDELGLGDDDPEAVSYTHLTLPTILLV